MIQFMRKLILKILIKFFVKIDSIKSKKYLIDPNIKVGKNVFVANTATLETRFGGTIKIGANTKIWDGVLILTYGGNIEIGENCSINPYTIIYGHSRTTIGNNVLIAGHSMIIPANHNFERNDLPIKEQGETKIGISIEDDVWIAHGCSILDNVKISKGSIIGAGSVVTKSTEPYGIYVGVPAKLIKKRI